MEDLTYAPYAIMQAIVLSFIGRDLYEPHTDAACGQRMAYLWAKAIADNLNRAGFIYDEDRPTESPPSAPLMEKATTDDLYGILFSVVWDTILEYENICYGMIDIPLAGYPDLTRRICKGIIASDSLICSMNVPEKEREALYKGFSSFNTTFYFE